MPSTAASRIAACAFKVVTHARHISSLMDRDWHTERPPSLSAAKKSYARKMTEGGCKSLIPIAYFCRNRLSRLDVTLSMS
jgi:hypothetical protein